MNSSVQNDFVNYKNKEIKKLNTKCSTFKELKTILKAISKKKKKKLKNIG